MSIISTEKNRRFPSALASAAHGKGFDDKAQEIQETGKRSAVDKFNADYPPGKSLPNNMSEQGRWYAFGEWDAISHYTE